MKRFRRLRKVLLYGLAVLVLLLLAAVAAARLYLSSDAAVQKVAARLEEVFGGPVRLDSVDIGLSGDSSLQGLKVFPPGGDKPWIEMADIAADVSVLGMLVGNGPENVRLQSPAVTLHLNEDNHLVTPLPTVKSGGGAVPRVVVRDGKLTIDQDGRPAMAISGLQAELAPAEDGIKVKGTINDPYWGEWRLDLTFDTATRALAVRLESEPSHITLAKLRSLPVISEHIWDQVQVDGTTPIVFEMTYRPVAAGETSAHVHYRVELEPRDTTVHVSSINLDAEHTQGKVVIEDKVVTLTGVRGGTAEGEIRTDAVLDFRPADSDLDFKIDVQDVILRALPKGWKVPPTVDGKLTGHADLRVTIVKGHAVTRGKGQGRIADVRLLGLFPRKKPILLEFRADESGFHFDPVIAPAAALVPSRSSPGGHDYAEIDVSLEDVDVAEMAAGFPARVPVPLAGRLSVRLRVGVPMDTPADLKAYRLSGSATAPRLECAGLEMTGVQAEVRYEDGVLRLTKLTGRVHGPEGGGTFSGTAQVEVFPAGNLTADLRLDDVPLGRALALLPGATDAAGSSLSAVLTARASFERLGEPAAWEGTASLRSDRLHLCGLTLTGAAARLTAQHGTVLLHNLDAHLEGAPITGSGEMHLAAPYACKVQVGLKDFDLAALERLAPSLRPPVSISGRVRFEAELQATLQPPVLNASGKAGGTDLVVDGVAVDSLAFDWTHDGGDLRLRSLQARMYDGEVAGSIDVPAAADAPGKADLHIHNLDLRGLIKAFPLVPMQVEGRVSGTLQGNLSGTGPDRRRGLAAQIDLSVPELRVQGVLAQKVQGSFAYRAGGAADYRLGGESLGGRFRLEGRLPPRAARPPEDAPPLPDAPARPPDGRLVVEGIRLSRLWETYNLQDVLRPLSGVVALDLPYHHEGRGGRPVGSGHIRIQEVRWDGADLAQGFQGYLRLRPDALELLNVTGSVGQGLIRARVRVPLVQREDGTFSLALEQVEAAQLLAPWPEMASRVQGLLDVSLHGRLAAEARAGGEVSLTHGRLLGIEVSEWRMPLKVVFAPRVGQGEVTASDCHISLAHGRALGRAHLTWGAGVRLEGELRFFDLDLHALGSFSGEGGSLAAGRLNGRLEFGGSDIHSLDDLNATLGVTLHQAQALELPVLRQVAPYIRAGMSSATFQSGHLEARLAHGLVRIPRLTVEGGILQMVVEGTVTVAGRLNLEVTSRTDNQTAVPGLGLLRAPASGTMPLSLLTEASILLANRVVRLRVTGSVHNPIIQVEPGRLLSEEAVRFFLRPAALLAP
jgi:translocation and assembly module TamB